MHKKQNTETKINKASNADKSWLQKLPCKLWEVTKWLFKRVSFSYAFSLLKELLTEFL